MGIDYITQCMKMTDQRTAICLLSEVVTVICRCRSFITISLYSYINLSKSLTNSTQVLSTFKWTNILVILLTNFSSGD
ncbi:hypothetical protein BpHYR1_042642 [Brachionus plicatilis]|uniref:Uncharacterized protein n=1 Tax=Brachionus plicatilis TaxID=10195 RepID=A0A3M7T8D6_BRAPC|nr:hypothetical protein BpHYR1_042642 [Brachionus plicatilis]